MKNLMRSNIYDVEETIVIVGSCLKNIQPQGYEQVKRLSENIYELCLEETHINMAITKIGGMLRTAKIKNIIDNDIISMSKSLGKLKNTMKKMEE